MAVKTIHGHFPDALMGACAVASPHASGADRPVGDDTGVENP
jgi:hypothetical protein